MAKKHDENIQKKLIEALQVTSQMKAELAREKAENDYLEKIVKKMEKIVLGGR